MAKSPSEYFEMFNAQFHPLEFAAIMAEPNDDMKYMKFFINWSLKEAFIKAIGIGLGFNLLDVPYRIDENNNQIMKCIL